MTSCKCKWDGALDGTLRRCRQHQDLINLERKMHADFEKQLQRALAEHKI